MSAKVAKTKKSAEQRRYPRVDETVRIQVGQGPEQMTTETVNVSCGGALCFLNYPLPLMTKVAVDLALPKQMVHCTGVVVRCEPIKKEGTAQSRYRVALYFLELGRQDHRAIAEFVLSSMFTNTTATHGHRRS